MWRLRHPVADHQHQRRRCEADQEQAAPTDHRREESAGHRTQQVARRQQHRRQSAHPAALVRRDEFLYQRDVHRDQAGIAEADEETEERQEQPAGNQRVLSRRHGHDAGGDRHVQRGCHEHLATADLVGHPAPEERSGHGAETGRQQDHRRLAEGQLPGPDDEGQHVADQEEIEEVEHVAEIRRGDDPPLIACQLLLLLQVFEHCVLPCSSGTARRSRKRRDDDGDGLCSMAMVGSAALPSGVNAMRPLAPGRAGTGWFFCPPYAYHKHRPLELVSPKLSRTEGIDDKCNRKRTAHPSRRRHHDGRPDAAVLAARREVLGSRCRQRAAAAHAAGREVGRVPRPHGTRRCDGSSLPASLRIAVLWPQRAGRAALRLSWLAVRRGRQLRRYAEPDAGAGLSREGACQGLQGYRAGRGDLGLHGRARRGAADAGDRGDAAGGKRSLHHVHAARVQLVAGAGRRHRHLAFQLAACRVGAARAGRSGQLADVPGQQPRARLPRDGYRLGHDVLRLSSGRGKTGRTGASRISPFRSGPSSRRATSWIA